MSTARHREMSGSVHSGYEWGSRASTGWVESLLDTNSYQPLYREMNDIVGNPFGDNAANSQYITRSGGTVSGDCYYGSSKQFKRRYEEYPYYSFWPTISHLALPNEPSPLDAAVTGSAMGNPSKPSISLAVSIAELRELPSLVLKKHRRGQTNSVVESEFGWAPMISDITKLFEFPDLMESRLKTLSLLKKEGQIRRRRTVWDETLTTIGPQTTFKVFQIGRLEGRTSVTTTGTCSVTSRWKANSDISNIGDTEMASYARQLVLGMSPQMLISSGWDLLPWSWCIDWFSNFGDFLSLTNNTVAYPSGPACVSYVTDTVQKDLLNVRPSWASVSAACSRRREWQRFITAAAFPSFRLPVLTGRQTLILSSIAFNRSR